VGADIIALIQHLGGPAVVIGHSFSTGSAVVAAAQAPTDVLGIVLIAPFASPPKLNPLLALLAKPVMRSPTLWAMYYRSLYPGTKPADFGGYLAPSRPTCASPAAWRPPPPWPTRPTTRPGPLGPGSGAPP